MIPYTKKTERQIITTSNETLKGLIKLVDRNGTHQKKEKTPRKTHQHQIKPDKVTWSASHVSGSSQLR